MQFWNGRRRASTWKGAAAGAIGGFVASWTMNQFQSVWSKASEALESNQSSRSNGRSRQDEEEENTTVKTAEIITQRVSGRRLREREKPKAGALVHYGFGTLIGAVYGAASEHIPLTKSAWGMPYGAAVFVGADEIAVPALGLSKSPFEYPVSKHAYALASHVVYGAVLESVRRGIRATLLR
jgi:putative membrane protein